MIFKLWIRPPRMFLTSWSFSPSLPAVEVGEWCLEIFRPLSTVSKDQGMLGVPAHCWNVTRLPTPLQFPPVWLTWNVHGPCCPLPETFHGLRVKSTALCVAWKTSTAWPLPNSTSSLTFCLQQRQTSYELLHRTSLCFSSSSYSGMSFLFFYPWLISLSWIGYPFSLL